MSSQLAQTGDMALVNHLSGQAAPVASASGSPPTWIPGLAWYNTTASQFESWNGTSWVTSPVPGSRWLALLTTDPVLGGAVNISDIGFTECTTAGYARQPVTFTQASAAYPSSASNTSVITFGPMSATMLVPCQWAALVTCSSGTNGLFLASWYLSQPLQCNASQFLQCGTGELIVQGQ